MAEIIPAGEHEIANVGPTREWDFKGDSGAVEMATDSVQFKGYEDYWVDLNRARKADKPKVGDKVSGSASQDNEKFPPKFTKEKKNGGGWRGGGGGGSATPGQIWGSNVQIAANILAGYYAAKKTEPKDITEYVGKIEKLAPKVNTMVDRLVAANPAKTEAKPVDTAASESGETASPKPTPTTPAKSVDIQDISDEDLGDW